MALINYCDYEIKGTLTTGSTITAGGIITAPGGTSTEWNTSYDNMATAIAFSGTTTKTLTLTQQDGGVLTASFTDNNDNTNYYTTTATFNTTNGIISFSGAGGQPTYSVDIDGRYALSSVVSGVTSVATAGTINGLTLTGGTITTTGTVTLGGTLAINNSDWSGTVLSIANGGTGASSATSAIGNLGATTIGKSMFTLTSPGAITFPRFNANDSVTALSASAFRTAIGAGTSSTTGTVTSVAALTLGTSGTNLSSTVSGSTGAAVITLNVPTASALNRGALSAADWTTFNNKSGNAGTVTSVSTTSGTGITSSVSNATTTPGITITNTDKGSSQNIFKNVLSDSGTAVADNNNDTLSIIGAGNISTAVVGDVLTITGSDNAGVTSVATAGTVSGLTLTGGTITSTGTITLGGTLSLTSANVTTALGFTPYNSTNPSGFTAFAEPGIFSGGGTPTLASGVTGAEIRTLIGAGTSSSAGVTSVATGTGLTGGTITSTGTLSLAAGGAGAAVYGSTSNSTKIDTITLDAYGRVTAVATGATGQVNTVATGNSSTLSSSGTTAKTLTPVTAAVSSGSANLATGAQIQTAINTALVGVLSYQGTWNASTNAPTLASGVGTAGYYYIVSVAGSTNLDGITSWAVGDWAVFSDLATDAWQKIDNTQVGNVTGSGSSGRVAYWNSSSNITSSGNMTFNGANLGVSGVMSAFGGNSTEWNTAYDNQVTAFSDSGSSTITLTLTQQDGGTLTTSFSNPQGTVTGVTATSPVVSSGGTAPVISMPAASGSVSGYLTSTNWTTFNNKTTNTGTVTSVAATASTGISISGSPITTSGTFVITNTAPNIVQTTVSGNAGSVTNGVYTIGTQSIGGAKTFTTTPISVTRSTADSSTYLATTAFVKNQGYITSYVNNNYYVSGASQSGGTLTLTRNGLSTLTATGFTNASNTQTFTNKSGNISQWTNDSGYTTSVGDITSVGAGTGLSGGGSSGAVTLTLDLGELAVGGTLIATDYLIAENGGVDNRQLISSIPLSIFSNNAGWTSNSGDITGVTAGSGISGGGTSGTVTITNSAPNIVQTTISGNAYSATVLQTARTIAGVSFNGSANISLNNNAITNGAGYTGNVGDITGVTAGTGITGGGTSGTVTISHADTSSQATVNNSGNTYIQDVTLDTFGHVTGLVSSTTTLGGLGFTGATNANYITNNNQLTNGAGYTTNTGTVTGTVSASESINTIAQRNSSGYLHAAYFNGSGTFSTTGTTSGMGRFTGTNGTDTYGRSYTAAAARTLLNVANGATNVTNNNQLTNGAGYITSYVNNNYYVSAASYASGTLTLTRNGLSTLTATGFPTSNSQLSNGAGYTGNVGTVTSVRAVTNGTSLGTSNTITTSGSMSLPWQGTSAQYVNGAGNLTTFPSIPQGDITAVVAGTGLSGGGTSGSVTLNNTITNNNQLTNGAGYTTNTGTTTASNTQTFTNKSGNISQWTNNSGYVTSSGVTSIATSSPLLGGTITSSGTLSVLQPVSGAWHNGGCPRVNASMEIGRYLDFHTSNTGTSDYDVRMDANGTELLISGNVRASGNLEAVGNIVAGYVRAIGGSAYTPSHSFNSDQNTGMFNPAADTLQFSTGGAYRWSTNNYATIINQDCGIGVTPLAKFHVNGVSLIRTTTGVGDFYLGNYATANHFRFHTNNSNTYFDMNCGNVYWRQSGSTRYTFFPSTANMTVNGTITQNSDIRKKENIVEIDDCISKVKAMRGVYYNRTDINTEVTKVGVIAQEVEKVLPELILESPEDGLKSVAYSELTAVLINAIKEQQEMIEGLKTRIEQLEN